MAPRPPKPGIAKPHRATTKLPLPKTRRKPAPAQPATTPESDDISDKDVFSVNDRQSLARRAQRHAPEALRHLLKLMRHAKSESVQLTAALSIIERGYGKPTQPLEGSLTEEVAITLKDIKQRDLDNLEQIFGRLMSGNAVDLVQHGGEGGVYAAAPADNGADDDEDLAPVTPPKRGGMY